MKTKKAVIFDLDGTVLDTMGDIAAAVNRALFSVGAPERTLNEVKSFIGNGSFMLIKRALPEGYDDKACLEVRERFRTEYESDMYTNTKPYDGIAELLHELSSMGVSVAVVTNKDDRCAVPMIKHYFGESVGYVRGVRNDSERKPSVFTTRSALEFFSASADEALFVGDGMADLQTADKCGIDYIPVGYGYTDKKRLFDACGKEPVENVLELRREIIKWF